MGKYRCLKEIASRLGRLRSDLWNKYGSLKAWDLTSYQVRQKFKLKYEYYQVSYKQWEVTLLSVIDDIHAAQSSAKDAVVKELYKEFEPEKAKKLTSLLKKTTDWQKNNLLHNKVRKDYFRGHTKVKNQIVLPDGCYSTFVHKNLTWLAVPSLQRGKRINIPLNSQYNIFGRIRLLLVNDKVEVHFTTPIECQNNCGNKKLGIDRGYSEVFVDSEWQFLGTNFGRIQETESEYRNNKQRARNKLRSIAKKAADKGNQALAQRIRLSNLGKKKWNRREFIFKSRIKDKVYKSVHQLCEKASTIVYEDLTEPIASNKPRSKKIKRSLNTY